MTFKPHCAAASRLVIQAAIDCFAPAPLRLMSSATGMLSTTDHDRGERPGGEVTKAFDILERPRLARRNVIERRDDVRGTRLANRVQRHRIGRPEPPPSLLHGSYPPM